MFSFILFYSISVFSIFIKKRMKYSQIFFHLSLILPSAVFFRIPVFLYLYIWPCIPVSPYPHLLSLYLCNPVVLHSCIPLYSPVFSCISLYSSVFFYNSSPVSLYSCIPCIHAYSCIAVSYLKMIPGLYLHGK